ncbi:MAG: alpha/beta hydrolase [Desulfarculaceae bacterium]|nr:alpha/beta hydrolase [Desulfarculaceae bacterium]
MKNRILYAILRHLKSRPTFDQTGIEKHRALLEKGAIAFGTDKSVMFESFDIQGIEAAWVTPPDTSSGKTILYLHGGGFMAGSIHSHRDLASRIAKAACAKLVLIDYRLAPEHPYPAGLDDAFTACRYLLDQGILPEKLCIAGDSAGGGLALSLLIRLKMERLPMPGCAVFLSPWVDLECRGKSMTENRDNDPMLSKELLQKTVGVYTDRDPSGPLISPLNADFTGLSPMLVHAGENEVLLDDAVRLAEKARHYGIKAEIETYGGMFHVFQYFARYLDKANESIQKIGTFIQNNP